MNKKKTNRKENPPLGHRETGFACELPLKYSWHTDCPCLPFSVSWNHRRGDSRETRGILLILEFQIHESRDLHL